MSFSPTANSSGPVAALKYMCDRANVEHSFNLSPSLVDPAGICSASIFFKNSGKKLVRITDRSAVHFLEPNETLCIGISQDGKVPDIVALNNGV